MYVVIVFRPSNLYVCVARQKQTMNCEADCFETRTDPEHSKLMVFVVYLKPGYPLSAAIFAVVSDLVVFAVRLFLLH